MRRLFKKPGVLIFLVALVPMYLGALGMLFLHEILTGVPYAKLDFESALGLPIGGMLVVMGCLFFMVPLYRMVAVNEWRQRWHVEADLYWYQQQEQTIKNLENWVANLDREKFLAIKGVHELPGWNHLRTPSPLRH